MVKTEITKNDGTKIVIEGSEEEVKKMIDYVTHSSNQKPTPLKKEKSKKTNSTSKVSIADQIEELKIEGFFDEPKSIGEIKSALSEKGMIYPITTLSGKLIEKVRRRELGRVKEDKKWRYVKR